MDEDNNRNTFKEAANQIKQFTKQRLKTTIGAVAKRAALAIGHFIIATWPFWIGVLLILIIFTIFLDFTDDTETKDYIDTATTGAVQGATATQTQNSVSIVGKNEGFQFNEQYTTESMQYIDQVDSNYEAIDFVSQDGTDMLYQYYKTQMKSMLFQICEDDVDDDEKGIIDGKIKLYRDAYIYDHYEKYQLEYLDYDDLKKMIDNNEYESLNYFTLDSNLNVIIAVSIDHYVNGQLVSWEITMSSLYEYLSKVEQFAVPLNFSTALHMGIWEVPGYNDDGEVENLSIDFMKAFYKAVIGRTSSVEMTFIEIPTVHITIYMRGGI